MNTGNQKGDMLSNVYLLILRLFLPVFTFSFVFQPKFAKIIDSGAPREALGAALGRSPIAK